MSSRWIPDRSIVLAKAKCRELGGKYAAVLELGTGAEGSGAQRIKWVLEEIMK